MGYTKGRKIEVFRVKYIEEDVTVEYVENLPDSEKDKIEYYDETSGKWLKYNSNNFMVRSGFPNVSKAENPVVLISIKNSITGHTVTFGEKEYTGSTDNLTYIQCEEEKELLRKFFTFLHKNPPNVISGWNCMGFDLPYLINRDKLINNGNYYTLMSPLRVVRTWESKKNNELNIDIAGITILDYLDIYKWYTPHNLERHSLEYVSQFELGVGKLDYSDSAEGLRELYHNDWNKYVDYNIVDCERVNDLGKKLGYIRLIQSLSLLTRVPMRYYNAMTSLIEGLMLTYYRRNNLCAPYLEGGSQETFEAAYVKEPHKGFHSWLFSIDIQSSYPSHIITLNMSTETYYGRIMAMTEDEIVHCMKNKEFPSEVVIRKGYDVDRMKGDRLKKFNEAIKRGLFSVAPCGTMFINNRPGVISTVEHNVFDKRIQIKQLMRKAKKGEKRERYFAIQQSLKIILNAVFGATSVPYSRYFNTDIAEAITSCGRYTIKSGEKYVNNILGKPNSELKELIKKL
jgi:DNA polymerase elongation subunit (family B)